MTLSAIIMGTVRMRSTEPNTPTRQRGRRNAMADVTVGISADQLQNLEEMVQTFVPDFFNPAAASATAVRYQSSHRRRNAVANVVGELSSDDLQHLEELVQTHQPTTGKAFTYPSLDNGNSSSDGEEACSSPSAVSPEPAYYGRRRNALANALANLDDETLRRIQAIHNSRNRSVHSARH